MSAEVLRIVDLPEPERPRERLLERGSGAISDVELVAVLLRTGAAGVSALRLAGEVMRERGGLAGLLDTEARHLDRFGIGPAKAAMLLAAVELGRRLARSELPDRTPMERPAAVARYLELRYLRRLQEVVGALYLDARNRLLSDQELYRGTINRSLVEPRLVLVEALLRGASGVVLFHTHPSGDPTPSAEDLQFTRRLAEAGKVIGVELIDHLIIAHGGRWLSLRERGAW
ncbi:MAG TPA: DNA repair protein RadC [Thermoanaerobaculia bacterium]|nr:DNA repair protein RadC [Thermoanaerobaculia bacterium]